jgi:hypothetical protein
VGHLAVISSFQTRRTFIARGTTSDTHLTILIQCRPCVHVLGGVVPFSKEMPYRYCYGMGVTGTVRRNGLRSDSHEVSQDA